MKNRHPCSIDMIDMIKEKEKIDRMEGSCGPAAVAGCWPGSCLISSLLRVTEAAAECLWDLDPSAVGQTRDHLEAVRLGQGAGRSVKNSSNGLNFTKKRAKNGHFFSQKRAKLQNFNQKNRRFQSKFKTYSLKYF